MKIKFIDIETRPLPLADLEKVMPEFTAPSNWKDPEKIAANVAEQKQAWIQKAALSPLTASVAAVGLDLDVDAGITILEDSTASEADILQNTWDGISQSGSYPIPVSGWNIREFDIPFLIKRSWFNGVNVPWTTLEWFRGSSSLNGQFQDLMQWFGITYADKYTKLDTVAKLLGLSGKVDLGGKLWYEIEDTGIATEYLIQDVKLLRQIHNRIAV